MALTQQDRPRVVTRRLVTHLVAFALFGAALYGVGVLMPYYVNDLDRLPLRQVTYNHDPKDLWPQGPLAGLVQIAGLLSLLLTPIVLGAAAVLSGCVLLYGLFARNERPSPAITLVLLGVVVGCIACLDFVGSPMWDALATWRLD